MQNTTVLNLGKTLTEPLLLIMAVVVMALITAMVRERRERGRTSWPLRLALLSILGLSALSTGLVASTLDDSLQLADEKPSFLPEVIVVASGGSVPTAGLRARVLSHASEARAVAGAAWWKVHPEARIIISGGDEQPGGISTLTLDLMRARMIEHGVPPERITLETASRNTREHGPNVLRMPGINRNTRIGLVTSGWHMRRAAQVFRRQFANVGLHSADRRFREPFQIGDLVPGSSALRYSTLMLQEWIGLAWYALRR